VLLLVALGLAISQVLPSKKDNRVASKDGKVKGARNVGDKEREEPADKDKDKKGKSDTTETEKDKDKGKDNGSHEKPKDKDKTGSSTADKEKDDGTVERRTPPSTVRVKAGNYAGSFAEDLPSVLVQKQQGVEGWQRVKRGAVVSTADTLMALPGYNGVIRTSKGAWITLAGHVLDFSLFTEQTFLGESVVVLHQSDKFDLDLTLLRGRIFLQNKKEKGPLTVRLRFEQEVWDMTLADRTTEVGVDLFKRYTVEINYRADEEPRGQAALCLFNGELELKVDAYQSRTMEVEAPKVKVVFWDSFTKAGDPIPADKRPLIWDKRPPSPEILPAARREDLKRMTKALKDLEVLLGVRKVDVGLKETLKAKEMDSRKLAIYCLGAIDDISELIDVLGDEDPDHWVDRGAAIFTLQRFISRGVREGKMLYDQKTSTGVLLDKKYKQREAETIYDLLHDFSPENWNKVETYQALARSLQHKRVAIAELAYYHLVRLARGVMLPKGFNPAAPIEDRERYAAQIEAMIEKKQLPPPPPERPKGKELPPP
jgi:hypothetical protein